jgi:hypothetical protein
MVQAAHRDQIGDRVVLVSVRLDDHQALMQALPGIGIPAQRSAERDQGTVYSPFGRAERRTLEVSQSDPVTINE